MTLSELVSSLQNSPYLFIGSGLTRRYLGLPDWVSLLKHFSAKISNDEFSFEKYVNQARQLKCSHGLLPKVAELIEADFNQRWFSDPAFRTGDPNLLKSVHEQVSPFKVEIAAYLKENFAFVPDYEEERELLARLAGRSVRGIITTNYDSFLEELMPEFQTFVGQKELIFSPIHGVGEIYKIHGSVTAPGSIVINENDYEYFSSHCSYLAAKLLTIFMEYPIIFIGYSISDKNIQNILLSICECLDDSQIKRLGDRMIFIEYSPNNPEAVISNHSILLGDRFLHMKKVELSDFSDLYKEIYQLKTKVPVSLLRKFKEDLYEFVVSNNPKGNLLVSSLDNESLDGSDLVLAIGRAPETAIKGLSGINSDEYYYSIVMDSLNYSPDDLLIYAYKNLNKQNAYRLPGWKYLSASTNDYPDIRAQLLEKMRFERIISKTIIKNRDKLGNYTSISEIVASEGNDYLRITELVAYLQESQIDVFELETLLRKILIKHPNLSSMTPQLKTNTRRLIKIYDALKWGN